MAAMLAAIKDDLAALNIHHDVFFSERSLTQCGHDEVKVTIDELRAKGMIFEGRLPKPKGHDEADWEDREQTLFRSTAFGDDVDRALQKSDGSYTYFASDLAYHHNKLARGFLHLINVFGADHVGYISRMQRRRHGALGTAGRPRHQGLPAGEAVACWRAGADVEALGHLRDLARRGR